MGLDLNMSMLLRDWIARYGIVGPLLTLGVQSLNYAREELSRALGTPIGDRDRPQVTAREFFEHCGIAETLSLDFSDYEGADIILDLNNPDIPDQLRSRFGCILNGGTIEHVFHIPNALATISRMLRPNGIVIHQIPVHNWVDHGFYQLCPTLLFDYYSAARFEILESLGLLFQANRRGDSEVIPVLPGTFGYGHCGAFGTRALLCLFAARKRTDALDAVVPIQSLYASAPVRPPATLRWFAPFAMQDGLRIRETSFDEITLGPFSQENGLAWQAPLPSGFPNGDTIDAPARSPLVLFEDDALLGPPHMSHDLVRSRGKGAYSHWGGRIIFSTSDGSDPNTNGRAYIARISRR